jgi:hypothetical protein
MSDLPDEDTILFVPMSRPAGPAAPSNPYGDLRSDDSPYGDLRDGDGHGGAIAKPFAEFAGEFRLFVGQIQRLLDSMPKIGQGYTLDEVEVSAGISATGKLALFGIGGESGVEGGLKFVFKRSAAAGEPADPHNG